MGVAGNSIIARFGLDLQGLKGDLSQAERLFVRASNDITAKTRGMGEGSHGGAGSALTRPLGDVIDLAKGSKGAVMELNALEHALGFSLGAGVGIIAAVAGFERLHEELKKVREVNDEVAKSFNRSTESIVGGGLPAITERLAEIETLSEKLKSSRGISSSLASMFGSDLQMQSLREQFKLESQRAEILGMAANKIREETAARGQAVAAGERETESLKVREQLEDKIAKIKGDVKLHGTGLATPLINQAKAEAEISQQAVDDKFDAKERELSLERQIAHLKSTYDKPEKLVAQARIDAAEADLAAARSPEAKDLANTKLAAANAELAAARKSDGKERKGERIAREKAQDQQEDADAAKALKEGAKLREDKRLHRIESEKELDRAEDKEASERLKLQHSVTERSKLGLDDLAKHGHGADANAAKRALRLEEQARRHALHGHARPDLIQRADSIRNRIHSVKDAEKTDVALKSAIDGAQVLRNIESNTAKPLKMI